MLSHLRKLSEKKSQFSISKKKDKIILLSLIMFHGIAFALCNHVAYTREVALLAMEIRYF